MEKFVCQNPFPAILRRKKVPMATKPRGGGREGPYSGRATKKRTFFSGFPNSPLKNKIYNIYFTDILLKYKKKIKRLNFIMYSLFLNKF